MTDPYCSVVLPTNRLGPWLSAAANSILSNPAGFECLIVLDGVDVPRESWAADPRVRFHRLPTSRGLAHALNSGVALARAPLVARMDADDIAGPDRLLKQVSYLTTHPDAVAVGSAARLMRDDGTITGGVIGRFAAEDVRRRLLWRNAIVHPTVMFRRQAFDDVGGYDETMSTMEDYDLWLRLGVIGPLAVLADPLLDYRVHGSQMSRSAPGRGSHIDRIGASRMELARAMGIPSVCAAALHQVWVSHQRARFSGVIRAGYVRRLGGPDR